MSIATKTATVLLATTALCGIGSVAAAAYADAPATSTASHPAGGSHVGSDVGKAQYSRGFHVTNLSGSTATVAQVDGNTSFEGRPADGSVLLRQRHHQHRHLRPVRRLRSATRGCGGPP